MFTKKEYPSEFWSLRFSAGMVLILNTHFAMQGDMVALFFAVSLLLCWILREVLLFRLKRDIDKWNARLDNLDQNLQDLNKKI